MNMLAICNASLQPTVLEFLIKLDKIMGWAASNFLNNIIDQLVLLAESWI